MTEYPLVVTTETEKGKRQGRELTVVSYFMGFLFFSMAVYFAIAPDRFFHHPQGVGERIWMFILCSAVSAGGILQPRFETRGNWRLDNIGIFFTPLRGKPMSVAWDEVNAVYAPSVQTRQIFLRDGKTKLSINLQWENDQQREKVVNILREKLGGAFNIFVDCPSGKISLRRLLKITAITSSIFLLWFGAFILQIHYLYQYELWRRWQFLWGLVPAVLFCLWSMRFSWRENQKRWSLRKPTASTRC